MELDSYYIVGIDGGASKTRGILFTDSGETLSEAKGGATNLVEYCDLVPERIMGIVSKLCDSAEISIDMVDIIGLGLAGASHKPGRELLFHLLEKVGLAQRALIINDAEAAFKVSCPTAPGFLVTVGTGAICIGRDIDGNSFRTGGLGHGEDGGIGSGYWLGKNLLMHLALNESSLSIDKDLSVFNNKLISKTESKDFTGAIEKITYSEHKVLMIASLAKTICEFAERGNDLALALIQEATQGVAESIIELTREMKYKDDAIILTGNGSVVRNDNYRRCLDDALRFDFDKITWTFSSVSPAYGAGIIASSLIDLDIDVKDIVKKGAIAPA